MSDNLSFPKVQADPYPSYARVRQHAPVYLVEAAGFWVVSRYEGVLSMFKNPHFCSSSVLLAADIIVAAKDRVTRTGSFFLRGLHTWPLAIEKAGITPQAAL